MKIRNNTDVTFSAKTQQTIENALAHIGYMGDVVYVAKNPFDGGNDIQFDIIGEDDEHLFTIDIEANETF